MAYTDVNGLAATIEPYPGRGVLSIPCERINGRQEPSPSGPEGGRREQDVVRAEAQVDRFCRREAHRYRFWCDRKVGTTSGGAGADVGISSVRDCQQDALAGAFVDAVVGLCCLLEGQWGVDRD